MSILFCLFETAYLSEIFIDRKQKHLLLWVYNNEIRYIYIYKYVNAI
jgi:hypothetical protein